MNNLVAKTCAFFGCSVFLGFVMHSDYEMWQKRGRELYLASKATYFDTHIATVQPIAIMIVVLAILFGFCLILYEILQLAISKLFVFCIRKA